MATESTESQVTTNNTLTEESPADSVVKVKKKTVDTGADTESTSAESTSAETSADTSTETDYSSTYSNVPQTSSIINDMLKTDEAATTTQKIVSTAAANVPEIEVGTINHVDVSGQRELIDQLSKAQEEQVNKTIDNSIETGITDLQRTWEDAQADYQTQRDQIAADEQRALDNQVLYNEARGDRGGIGQAQYNTIQNTAATNRMTVNKEQTKLATDTQRQIADLRAQGEFERADQLLSVTQNYLSQLLELEQYAQQANLSIDEFNAQLGEWEAEYQMNVAQYITNTELSTAQLTGAFSSGTPTLAAYQSIVEQLANMGQAMIDAGITPTQEQLDAMGMTTEQFLQKYGKKISSGSSVGGGYSGAWLSGDAATDYEMVAALKSVGSSTQTQAQKDAVVNYNYLKDKYGG